MKKIGIYIDNSGGMATITEENCATIRAILAEEFGDDYNINYIASFDYEIKECVDINDDTDIEATMLRLTNNYGGGTLFVPLANHFEARRNHTDSMVVVTDGWFGDLVGDDLPLVTYFSHGDNLLFILASGKVFDPNKEINDDLPYGNISYLK